MDIFDVVAKAYTVVRNRDHMQIVILDNAEHQYTAIADKATQQ